MNNTKTTKNYRPKSSTDKGGGMRNKRRGDQTPEHQLTPDPSLTNIENKDQNTTQDLYNSLTKEDVDILTINLDEMKKQRPPKRPTVKKTKQISVRKGVKIKSNTSNANEKTFTYAKSVNPDFAQYKSYDKISVCDPSSDENTAPYYEHHMFGTLQEFHEQHQIKQLAKKLPQSYNNQQDNNEMIQSSSLNTRLIKGRIFSNKIFQHNVDQSNALKNWQNRMMERRKEQGHLAKFLGTTPDMLGMNQSEDYRRIQEERHLIERSSHTKDYGRGYRVGSEFWKQQELIGDENTGIHMSLTHTEQGFGPVFEHIDKPEYIKNEMGVNGCSNSQFNRSDMIHRPWKKSRYLQERKHDLKEIINELCPHKPYMNNLAVVGQTIVEEPKKHNEQEQRMKEARKCDENHKTCEQNDPLSGQPDIVGTSMVASFGPSLVIAGHSLSWNGSTTNCIGQIALVCPILLESYVTHRVISTLDIYNDGTAVIYYCWKSIPKENKLGVQLSNNKQRFYFDKNSGVILPGDTLKFPFIFKSQNAGMFDEEWELVTRPVLNGGAAIRVILKGLALQHDLNAEKRRELELQLTDRQTKHIVASILDEVLNNIRSPERPHSPIDAYITDEEIFTRQNPELCYNEEILVELKQLYEELATEEEWDLTLSSLRELITCKEFEDVEEKDVLLTRLNHHVGKLAFHHNTPLQQDMYNTCYVMLCELADELVTQSDVIRTAMELPLKEMIEGNTAADEGQNDKKAKKTSESSRLNVDKKDSKKERRSGDRPVSSRMKTPVPDKKASSKMLSQNSPKPSEVSDDSNSIVITTAPDTPITQSINEDTEKMYKEKLYFKTYSLVCETIEKMAGIFEDIQNQS